MAEQLDIHNLHPLEVQTLRALSEKGQIDAGGLVSVTGLKLGQANQALSWLAAKELISEVSRETQVSYEITDLGRDFAGNGLPEERILRVTAEGKSLTLPEMAAACGLEQRDVGSAYGKLAKAGATEMDGEKRVVLKDPDAASEVAVARTLLDRAADAGSLADASLSDEERRVMGGMSKKRGASGAPFRVVEQDAVVYRLSDAGARAVDAIAKAGLTGGELGALTPELLQNGEWKGRAFRSYNVQIPPSRTLLGRRNPYCSYLDDVKDRLRALGFEEFDGPLVETEFWNSDALFMPQFHAARDIHDVYHLAEPTHAKAIEEPYLSNVAAAHEDGWTTGSAGWGYSFDRDFTRRLILRSQGTVLSAKQLKDAKVPGKYFGIVRCFRHDQVDATHLSDFYQTEGIVLGEEVNLRTLLGLLKMFAEEVAGATEVKYVPGYFPFTEPSVEVHIKHPRLGWFELGGSGIFRPEVTKPFGVDVPVLAWGLGIDRMALMHLGLSDLRDLFALDIEQVRLRRTGDAEN